jgi:hypothetical protein
MVTSIRIFLVSLLFVSLVTLGLTEPVAAQQAGQSEAVVPTFSGQLTKIDVTAKMITVKGSEDKEMVFSYSDETQILGADDGIQGLTGKTGADVKVSYRDDQGTTRATKIEIQPKKVE